MSKIIIFGAATIGRDLADRIKNDKIVCFIDNDPARWGMQINNIPVKSPDSIDDWEDIDKVYLASISGPKEMKKQLIDFGVDERKVQMTENVSASIRARENFLNNISRMLNEDGVEGSVAEAGVFRGDFASLINKCFPYRKCYLFDTFEGFDSRDFVDEPNETDVKDAYYAKTSVDIVLSKMLYKENVIIRKGYFPDTAVNINETYAFVSLDLDLYKPTIEGLKYFYPRMNRGGVILIHDYYNDLYSGAKKAVDEFREVNSDVVMLPIGDDMSIAVMKQ